MVREFVSSCLEKSNGDNHSKIWEALYPLKQLVLQVVCAEPWSAKATHRLIWILDSIHLLPKAQFGFRRHRSTTDHVVNLEHHIQNAFFLRQHLVAILFDLQKACDTT